MAVIAGFLAMIGCASIVFTAAFVLLGEDAVFLPGSYETSGPWTALSVMLGFLTSAVGGVVCGSISPRPAPTWVLVGLVVFIDVAYAVVSLSCGAPGTRSGDAGLLEAQIQSQSPTWFLLAIPVIDVAGITLGSTLARHGGHSQPVALSVSDGSREPDSEVQGRRPTGSS